MKQICSYCGSSYEGKICPNCGALADIYLEEQFEETYSGEEVKEQKEGCEEKSTGVAGDYEEKVALNQEESEEEICEKDQREEDGDKNYEENRGFGEEIEEEVPKEGRWGTIETILFILWLIIIFVGAFWPN